MSNHLDIERAQLDLTTNLSLIRAHLRTIEKNKGNPRVRDVAKNYRNQLMQALRMADKVFGELR